VAIIAGSDTSEVSKRLLCGITDQVRRLQIVAKGCRYIPRPVIVNDWPAQTAPMSVRPASSNYAYPIHVFVTGFEGKGKPILEWASVSTIHTLYKNEMERQGTAHYNACDPDSLKDLDHVGLYHTKGAHSARFLWFCLILSQDFSRFFQDLFADEREGTAT
jgi:hypothetical protein